MKKSYRKPLCNVLSTFYSAQAYCQEKDEKMISRKPVLITKIHHWKKLTIFFCVAKNGGIFLDKKTTTTNCTVQMLT